MKKKLRVCCGIPDLGLIWETVCSKGASALSNNTLVDALKFRIVPLDNPTL